TVAENLAKKTSAGVGARKKRRTFPLISVSRSRPVSQSRKCDARSLLYPHTSSRGSAIAIKIQTSHPTMNPKSVAAARSSAKQTLCFKDHGGFAWLFNIAIHRRTWYFRGTEAWTMDALENGKTQLDRMSQSFGISKASVIEVALRGLAKRELPEFKGRSK